MLYIRKISEDGWFGKEELDADSVSELGTTNHDLSVWEITNNTGYSNIDDVALALAMTRDKVEELYVVFLDTTDINTRYKWAVSLNPEDGNTKYTKMKGCHTNFVVGSFWEQGFLAEYIHALIEDTQNYKYYNVDDLKKLAYEAAKRGDLTASELNNPWKKAVKEMGDVYGAITGF